MIAKCPVCDRNFTKFQHFKRHQRAHTGERPFKCTVCGKHFARRDVMVRHCRAHTSDDTTTHPDPIPSSPLSEASELATGMADFQGVVSLPGARKSILNRSTPNRTPPGPRQEDSARNLSHDLEKFGATEAMIRDGSFNFHTHQSQSLSSTKSRSLIDNCFPPENFGEDSNDGRGLGEREGSRDEVANLMILDELAASAPLPLSETTWSRPTNQTGNESQHWLSGPEMQSDLDLGAGQRGVTTLPGLQTFGTFDSQSLLAGLTAHLPSPLGISDWESSLDTTQKKRDKIASLWPARPGRVPPIMPTLWRDIASSTDRNLFSQASSLKENCLAGSPQTGHAPALLEKLRSLIRFISSSRCTCIALAPSPKHTTSSLDGNFYASGPLQQEKAAELCREAATLGSNAFSFVLERVYSEIVANSFAEITPEQRMCMFATSGLMSALYILDGGTSYPDQMRLLYINTLTAARQHGLFDTGVNTELSQLFKNTTEEDGQWIAWSRIESTKRTILLLILVDAWFSDHFSTGPIVCTGNINAFLPCNAMLFQATTASEWTRLMKLSSATAHPRFSLFYGEEELPDLQEPVEHLSMNAVLVSALLRIQDSHRTYLSICDNETLSRNHYIPWNCLALEEKARKDANLLLKIMEVYGTTIEKISSDCLVAWNWMGIMLTTDYCLLEEAAGRNGVEAAKNAIPKVRIWSQTPAARRACLHAAQAFRATSRRRTQDGGSFSASKLLFSAALVLALYLLVSPLEENDNSGCAKGFELLDDVDWNCLGTGGLSADVDQLSSSETGNAAADFIRLGGPVSMRNERCLGGLRSAQRVLLDFASLLDDMKKWRIGDYSRLLYVLCESLGDLCVVDESFARGVGGTVQ
ncbi:C2H2 type zinc finger domain-containing protein [Colletotrichum simmondsii]|uniref:C2H2 type zinc finger domain-containing protein n=1 Tax=Colletotrichum simmondsii TaxID=703756 RepID=A0A135T198_9PEZI|nr:C2H2 type zinc finger domain-containing protein [Colletotrichum simmondsii]